MTSDPTSQGKGAAKTVGVSAILGDYHTTAQIETFTASPNDRHPTELAKLRGARIVSAVETQEGRRWDETKIKQITGGDISAARFMRQDFFDFAPAFKLLIAGNHRPELRSVDEAIRRRMNLLPFTVTIPEGERDKDLADKLKAVHEEKPDQRVFIRGDKSINYGRMMEVMGAVIDAGFRQMGLLGEQAGGAPAGNAPATAAPAGRPAPAAPAPRR